MLHFVPRSLLHLFDRKKIVYNNFNLKTEYLADILHHMMSKRYFTKKRVVRLSSKVHRAKYGTFYNNYMDYLLTEGIIVLVSKEIIRQRCRGYQLTDATLHGGSARITTTSRVLAKKQQRRQEQQTSGELSPVKELLLADLSRVEIDYAAASQHLNEEYTQGRMSYDAYNRNAMSIDCIHYADLYHSEDTYGRFHTNFTVLKSTIRQQYLTIDGQPLGSCDIENCQPRLLAKVAQERGFADEHPQEFARFKQAVLANTFYDEYATVANVTRAKAKPMVYKVFFGRHQFNLDHNRYFFELYPNLWRWMYVEKLVANTHKLFAHELQKRESTLIFEQIIREIKAVSPQVVLFTVHDAIYFKKEDEHLVAPVFVKHVQQLFD